MAQPNIIFDFKTPPVIETVLSVQFQRIKELQLQKMVLFWNDLRDRFPKLEVKFPLEDVVGSDPISPRIVVEPELRCWFISEDQSKLIQLQNNRFIFNWRKITKQTSYVHYSATREDFKNEWGNFRQFLFDNSLGMTKVSQCEVTYINHIEINDQMKVSDVFPIINKDTAQHYLSSPTTLNASFDFETPDKKNKVHIKTSPAFRLSDQKKLITLDITARGVPEGFETNSLLKWFDAGREHVVRSFEDFTSPQMHKHWGKND